MIRKRYRRIIFFFARILVSIVIWDLIFPKIGLKKWSRGTRNNRYKRIAGTYRRMAIQMGGVFIKVGQFLSARVDVLPVVITDELAGLQDEVPSENFTDIRNVIESELGTPLADKFPIFDQNPLAAASLGQAHLAVLQLTSEQAMSLMDGIEIQKAGERIEYPVVVKVQRPDIERIIQTDLAAIDTVGRWIQRYPPIRKRANVPGLITEFSRTLYEEIDYLAEGRNAETFAFNFRNNPEVLVPKVVWSHTTKRVLTLQDVRGIKITDYDEITAAGIDKSEIASRLCETYLKQIFEDGFFHADPHPGNLFVMPITEEHLPVLEKNDWKLTFIDFGMVGRMKPEIRTGLRELLIGISLKDASRVVSAYQILGILLPGADTELLERAESEMFNRFWGKDMNELTNIKADEIHKIAFEFREILYDMPFQLPQDLIFLGRAIGILSGMCTGLDPHLNVFDHLGPFSKKIISEEGTHDWEYWLKEAGAIAKKVLVLPVRADALISRMERGELIVHDPQLTARVRKLEKAVARVAGAIVFSALLFSSLQLFINNQSTISVVFGIAAGIVLLWVLFG